MLHSYMKCDAISSATTQDIFFKFSRMIDKGLRFIKREENHVPHKTKKFKGLHSTDQVEIMNIDSFYPADLKKCKVH